MHTVDLQGVECPDNILITKLEAKEHLSFKVIGDSKSFLGNLKSWARVQEKHLDIQEQNNGKFEAVIS